MNFWLILSLWFCALSGLGLFLRSHPKLLTLVGILAGKFILTGLFLYFFKPRWQELTALLIFYFVMSFVFFKIYQTHQKKINK